MFLGDLTWVIFTFINDQITHSYKQLCNKLLTS